MRTLKRIGASAGVSLLATLLVTPAALAASAGCNSVNAGVMDYVGTSPTAHLGLSVGEFYPGDQLFMTYKTNTPKSGVALNLLLLTGLGADSVTTNGTATTYSLTATVGALLPLAAQAGITDLTALFNPRNVTMNVTCTAAAAPTSLSVASTTNPTVFGQTATFTASASSTGGTPTGNVVFTVDGNAQPATTLSNGLATFSTSALSVGNHSVSASYAGSAGAFHPSNGALAFGHNVNAAGTTTNVVTSAATSPFGGPVTFTATTTANAPGAGTPTGSIVFSIDTFDQTTVAMSNGVATLTRSDLGGGNHSVSARYVASTNFNSSTGNLSGGQAISKAATSTTLSQNSATTSFGENVTVRATVASAVGTPTGLVVFTVDGVPQLAQSLSGGIAEISSTLLGVGNHVISAEYFGTGNLAGSTGTLAGGHVVTVIPTTTVLSGPGAITYGDNALINAVVSSANGSPTGSVIFTVDGTPRAPTLLLAGNASILLTNLSAGNHAVSATYGGSALYGTSTGALSGGQAVNKAATTTTVTAPGSISYGGTLNLTANVASAAARPRVTWSSPSMARRARR